MKIKCFGFSSKCIRNSCRSYNHYLYDLDAQTDFPAAAYKYKLVYMATSHETIGCKCPCFYSDIPAFFLMSINKLEIAHNVTSSVRIPASYWQSVQIISHISTILYHNNVLNRVRRYNNWRQTLVITASTNNVNSHAETYMWCCPSSKCVLMSILALYWKELDQAVTNEHETEFINVT